MKTQTKLSKLLQIGLVLTFLLPAAAEGQIRNRIKYSDVKNDNLKGCVSELTNREYNVSYTDSICYVLKPNNFIFDQCNYKVTFNRQGYKTKKFDLRIDLNDLLVNTHEWFYYYDKTNRMIKERRISPPPQADSIIWNYTYLKDTINIIQTSNIITYDFTYIQKGDHELFFTYPNTTYSTKRIFVYDKLSRIIRKESYNTDNTASFIKFHYYSDTLTNAKSGESDVWCIMNSITNTTFTNDSLGNPIEEKTYYPYNNHYETLKNEYRYDKEGNWIEKKCYNAKGLLNSIIKRDIKYYK